MAELRQLKAAEFKRALSALQNAIEAEGEPTIIRDSVLMRFSFTSEIAWKALRLFVSEKGGNDTLVPKAAWREAQRMEILVPEETEVALKMVDDRNRLAHDYSEEFADALYGRVKKDYLPLLSKIAKAI